MAAAKRSRFCQTGAPAAIRCTEMLAQSIGTKLCDTFNAHNRKHRNPISELNLLRRECRCKPMNPRRCVELEELWFVTAESSPPNDVGPIRGIRITVGRISPPRIP